MGRIRGLDCSLAYGANTAHRCVWCGDALPPRRTIWCSDECSEGFRINHAWTNARRAAVIRAGHACHRCSLPPLQRPVRHAFGRDEAAFEVELERFLTAVQERHLEVNHIVPLVGAGYGLSCAHHQSNLEVLCHFHHVGETRVQRRERAGLPTMEQLALIAS